LDKLSILRPHESRKGCDICGDYHVLSYGGKHYCQDKDHFAHGPGWCNQSAPMSDEESRELLEEIKQRKNLSYSGGYAQWIKDRGIKNEE
jgi:hypothetical protein